jgi:hypothetical protein
MGIPQGMKGELQSVAKFEECLRRTLPLKAVSAGTKLG